MAISDVIPINVNSFESREVSTIDISYPENKDKYKLVMFSVPSKFTYHDGKAVVFQLTKGDEYVMMPIEV